MRLSLLVEQFIARRHSTSIGEISHRFALSPEACRHVLDEVTPYGVTVEPDGTVLCQISGTPPSW